MSDKTHYCSFCGKSRDMVAKLIADPLVFICNECTDLSQEIAHDLPAAAEERRQAAR